MTHKTMTPIMELKFKRKPYEHQLKMTQRCVQMKRYALLCEMGTGKTQAIINTFQVLKTIDRAKKCLIVCPLSVVGTWISEIIANSDYQFAVLTGTKKQRMKYLDYRAEFYIINYEGLATMIDYETNRSAVIVHSNPFKDFDMVVLDESSKIKSHSAIRTRISLEAFKNIEFKYILTGTPVTQSPLDIFCQFWFLNPLILRNKNYYSFRNTYAIMGGYGKYQIVAYKNLPELKALIAGHSTQLKKEDCLDLPEKIYEVRRMDMSKDMITQYGEMTRDLITQISEDEFITASIVLTKIIRLQQILSGVYLPRKENIKLNALMEIIEDTGENIIVWCRFRESMREIEKELNKVKIKYSILHGDIKDRDKQIELFQKKETRIFLGQINTGGMGITLTAGTIMVYFENTYSLEDRLQSEARAHRIGQRFNVTYIDLLYNHSMEEIVMTAIKNKQDIAHEVVQCFKGGKYE